MFINFKLRHFTAFLAVTALFAGALFAVYERSGNNIALSTAANIKWVDFHATYPAMKKALDLDIKSHVDNETVKFNWLEILSYITAKNGNNFKNYRSSDIDSLVKKLKDGQTMEELTKDMKYYDHYLEIYNAVLGGFAGSYSVQSITEHDTYKFEEKYGLKAFSPIAKGYYFHHYDDFGNDRSYGYRRPHLGHDIMASLGTPIIAVESGIVEELGWNQYGGWRIGIRSLDSKRYYYYAHMRKNRPYAVNIAKGKRVTAGDVIGYVGRTGYSTTENVNNITDNHLHIGMQLIFDESQKDKNEIWIDMYAITKLLEANKSTVVRNNETKEYTRKYDVIIPANAETEDYDSPESIKVPLIMYHTLLNNPKKANEYEISVDAFEDDLKFLQENNYNTVTTEDIINFVYSGVPLPENPVMLTFDDGNYNNMYYALPLLRKYNYRAVISIVGQYSQNSTDTGDINPNYSYVTWDQVKELSDEGVFEVQNHSWNMHSSHGRRHGSQRAYNESFAAYEQFFKEDIMKLQDKITQVTGKTPQTYAYPFGLTSNGTTNFLKDMGFKVSFSCREGISEIKRGDPESLFLLKRFLRNPRRSVETLLGN